MFKLRLIFIISLVILAGVFIATIYFIPSAQRYPESKKSQIIRGENEWILQYDIVNNEEKDMRYDIQVAVDGAVYRDSTVVKQGRTYTYIYHIYPSQLEKGRVTFAVYKGGETKPIEQATYYVKP